MTTLGPLTLLNQPAIGFLCSRKAQSTAILPCLDWAVSVAKGNNPVMSTFHSELESAVLDVLLTGTCPIILVLGRTIYKVIPENLKPAFESGRLLIISVSNQPRISRESAYACNDYICKHSHSLTFGFLSPDSSLQPIYNDAKQRGISTQIITQN